MSAPLLPTLVESLRASRGFAHKRDIAGVVGALGRAAMPQGATTAVPVGDDCAAIPDGHGGHLLFAIEGFVDDFVEAMPWFAGYCGVMVNASDIYAMGGRPTAIVDALWSQNAEASAQLLAGMATASERYGIPVVGGHSNQRSPRAQLAVAILGRAGGRLLTSFNARPGDRLIAAIDLRGAYEQPYPYWNASTRAPAARLRADLEVLPRLAEAGLCDAAKDISMAGIAGTALMLLECSRAGAVLDLNALPRPDGVPLEQWLTTFPSYGFVLSVRPEHVAAVLVMFAARDIGCAVVGTVDAGSTLDLQLGAERRTLWDWADQPFITTGQEPREQRDAA